MRPLAIHQHAARVVLIAEDHLLIGQPTRLVVEGQPASPLETAGAPNVYIQSAEICGSDYLVCRLGDVDAIGARVWNLATGRLVLEIWEDDLEYAVHPTEPRLAVCMDDPAVLVEWDLRTGRRTSETVLPSTYQLPYPVYSGRSIVVFEPLVGEVRTVLEGKLGDVMPVEVSWGSRDIAASAAAPGEEVFAVCPTGTGYTQLWNPGGRPTVTFKHPEILSPDSVAFSKGLEWLAVGDDQRVALFRMASGLGTMLSMTAPFEFDSDGAALLAMSGDQLQRFDLASGPT